MSETQSKIGQILEGGEGQDAIHIAICPVVASAKLSPGQDIGFVEAGNYERVGISNKPIGIVDPFLNGMVFPETRFWMFLYPNTITSLRHVWVHPAFGPESDVVIMRAEVGDKVEASKKWMENFASGHYAPYENDRQYTADELIEAGKHYLRHGDRMVQQGSESLRDSTPSGEYWRHFEIITGIKVPEDQRVYVPFCCTC